MRHSSHVWGANVIIRPYRIIDCTLQCSFRLLSLVERGGLDIPLWKEELDPVLLLYVNSLYACLPRDQHTRAEMHIIERHRTARSDFFNTRLAYPTYTLIE